MNFSVFFYWLFLLLTMGGVFSLLNFSFNYLACDMHRTCSSRTCWLCVAFCPLGLHLNSFVFFVAASVRFWSILASGIWVEGIKSLSSLGVMYVCIYLFTFIRLPSFWIMWALCLLYEWEPEFWVVGNFLHFGGIFLPHAGLREAATRDWNFQAIDTCQ